MTQVERKATMLDYSQIRWINEAITDGMVVETPTMEAFDEAIIYGKSVLCRVAPDLWREVPYVNAYQNEVRQTPSVVEANLKRRQAELTRKVKEVLGCDVDTHTGHYGLYLTVLKREVEDMEGYEALAYELSSHNRLANAFAQMRRGERHEYSS